MAIVEKQPIGQLISPRQYRSQTLQETLLEVKNFKIQPKRNRLRLQFIKKRKEFHQACKFTQTDSDRNAQFQVFKDDLLGLKENVVMQIGLQGSQSYTSTGSQTVFKRKINKCLQIEQIIESNEPEVKVADNDLLAFLDNVYPEMESALQSNETIDIFQDDFDVLPKNQAGSGKDSEISNVIKQTKNLFYLGSKGKKVSCIRFQPWTSGKHNVPIIAESFVQNLTFDQRVIFSMKSSKSYILFWNYEDLHAINPLLILTSPLQILTFQFNPKDPNIVLAGTINGQILMWDLKNIELGHNPNKKGKKKELKNKIPQIAPIIMTALQDPSNAAQITDTIKKNVPSHKAPVVCLKWFPSGLQLDIKKSYSNLVPPTSSQINQFCSISVDGQVLLWEKKFVDAHKKPITDLSTFSWKANYGFHLFRPEGGGPMGGTFIEFKKNQKKTIFTGTSDQGQLFICDWSARSADEAGSKNDTIIGYWNQQRSYRPILALDLQPNIQDIILTVHDYHFCVWKANYEQPVFQSMVSYGCYNTCGCWSPTRAGVVFIGKSNGMIQIWDFIDQSHKYTIQYSVGSVGLSSMKFHDSNNSILSVGTMEGALHILELPFTLVRKIGDEDKAMKQFWDRQIESVSYFNKRFQTRFQQSQQFKAQQQLQQRIRQQKQQKKSKREDQDQLANTEYTEFSTKYLNQFIYKIEPLENEGGSPKANK